MKNLIITLMLAGFFPVIASAQSSDTCSTGLPSYVAMMNSNFMYRQAYDTMRYWYIPSCYRTSLAPQTAGALGGSAHIGVVLTNYDSVLDFRAFVLHCLTLRSDDEWFCSFLGILSGTYVDPKDIYNNDYRAERTITKYLIDNPRCANDLVGNEYTYQHLLDDQYNTWDDSANRYFKGEVFDSTIPTMQDLGLDTILKLNAMAGVNYETLGPQIISNASIMPNPTMGQATVSLSIEREAYVHIEVFDLLGEKENGIGYEGVFETGQYTTPLDLRNLPAGSYYVRVSTANNEVQTLKLVKE